MEKNIAIKQWFLEKQGFGAEEIRYLKENGFKIVRETEKAIYVEVSWFEKGERRQTWESWIPKSCLTDEWEITISKREINYKYHDYLMEVIKEAYKNDNLGEKRTIAGGYSKIAFYHRKKTQQLIEILNQYSVEFDTKEVFTKKLIERVAC